MRAAFVVTYMERCLEIRSSHKCVSRRYWRAVALEIGHFVAAPFCTRLLADMALT
jgi:hypothetical protein